LQKRFPADLYARFYIRHWEDSPVNNLLG